jgi:hypothetical protein
VTPAQIFNALSLSALPMSGATPNFFSGYGFIQADAALPLIPPGAPTLTLGAKAVALGNSTTLSWTSNNATSCTASGSWSGSRDSTGSVTLTPTAAGVTTYTLSCSNSAGASQSTSVSLTAGAAPTAPTVTLAATSITLGTSTTITWASTGTTSCTASGGWTGTLATSGTKTLTPTAAGAKTYSLTCASAAGVPSTASSVTLTAVAPAASSGGGGGGGDLEWLTLAALLAACLAQLGLPKGKLSARLLAKWKVARSAVRADRTKGLR